MVAGAVAPSRDADRVEFLAPDTAFQEAREWLPEIMDRRQLPVAPALASLDLIAGLVRAIGCDIYSSHEAIARQRIDKRDEGDWPVLASALAFDCRDLDGGRRLLRVRRGNVDNGPRGIVSGENRSRTTALNMSRPSIQCLGRRPSGLTPAMGEKSR